MTAAKTGELPYKTVAGVIPCVGGWLLVSAKIKGATFAPDFPRVYEKITDVISMRPPIAISSINAPIGAVELALKGSRRCDVAADALIGRDVPSTRWEGEAPSLDENSEGVGSERTAMLGARYRELAREMAPFLQRTICEGLPELSFFQINAEERLAHDMRSEEGFKERVGLLGKVPGITRILHHDLPDVTPYDLLEGAALMWSSRRVNARAGRRVPADPEWDERGLRIEILR